MPAGHLGRRGGLLWPGGRLWPVVAGTVLIAAGAGIRAEERQLTEALGTEYQDFAAHRKRLIPGVW